MASLSELQARLNQMKKEGKSESNSKKYAKLKAELQSNPVYQLQKQISSSIAELENKLNTLDNALSLTDEEKDAFLEKAIAQITPYYEQKKAEIESGIQEGRVQSAEDLLVTMRQVQEETNGLLAKYDIDQAESEEQFLDTMANITSTKEEDLGLKREEWRQKLEGVKMQQAQQGIFSSGIGAAKRADVQRLQEMDISRREADATRQATETERNYKYDIDRIRLAREEATKERIRRIGTPEEQAQLETQQKQTLGLNPTDQVGSIADIQAKRAERNISIRRPEELTSLTEERQKALESRNLELQTNELAVRKQRESANREKILSDLAAKRRQLEGLGA